MTKPMPLFRLLPPLCAGLLALVVGAGTALAHAELTASTPAKNSVQATPPREVVLEFGEKVEPSFSTVTVTDAAGKRIDAGKVVLDPARPTVLHVPLTGGASGKYVVVWRAVSVDTHVTRGRFGFEVK
ncbi:MAG TPA: copper resistance CopC family protein [Patescibacteria group bacterium]|nr:copper resistance CopC family protein [Patescibacteria group bacterium]